MPANNNRHLTGITEYTAEPQRNITHANTKHTKILELADSGFSHQPKNEYQPTTCRNTNCNRWAISYDILTNRQSELTSRQFLTNRQLLTNEN